MFSFGLRNVDVRPDIRKNEIAIDSCQILLNKVSL